MKNVLLTGAKGFIGKNLLEALQRRKDVSVTCIDVGDPDSCLFEALKGSDIVFHLAGVNRPQNEDEFESGNVGSTEKILSLLIEYNRSTPIVLSSSTQAELDNPYGRSKKKAEALIREYGRRSNAPVFIYRLPNVFGKWCRPNYNSVVATFCHNINRGLDIVISDRKREVNLVYIDDVISSFMRCLDGSSLPPEEFMTIEPSYTISLGDLADRLYAIRDIRKTMIMPDLGDRFSKCLYATYVSYLDEHDFAYSLTVNSDNRGNLAELLKSEHFGQIFVSKTFGGITRGNHYHNTKTEKFCVIKGRAVVKFRNIFTDEILSYCVSGDDLVMIDIPVGYTHSIENLSKDEEMIVLFWASEIFDPNSPDTYHKGVHCE